MRTRLKKVCFVYDLGFGGQQLILNSQVMISSSQTSYDFLKQTPLNSTFGASIERVLGLLI